MRDLIEALQIFIKYEDRTYPTNCDHDVLYVFVDPKIVSDEDKVRLDELGFFASSDGMGFQSFKFGNC